MCLCVCVKGGCECVFSHVKVWVTVSRRVVTVGSRFFSNNESRSRGSREERKVKCQKRTIDCIHPLPVYTCTHLHIHTHVQISIGRYTHEWTCPFFITFQRKQVESGEGWREMERRELYVCVCVVEDGRSRWSWDSTIPAGHCLWPKSLPVSRRLPVACESAVLTFKQQRLQRKWDETKCCCNFFSAR